MEKTHKKTQKTRFAIIFFLLSVKYIKIIRVLDKFVAVRSKEINRKMATKVRSKKCRQARFNVHRTNKFHFTDGSEYFTLFTHKHIHTHHKTITKINVNVFCLKCQHIN